MSRQSRRPLPWTILVSALFWSGLAPTETRAGAVKFNTVSNPAGDAASVTFTPLNGEIEITIANTATGTIVKSQAVSDLSFSVAGGLSVPSAIDKITGNTVNSAAFTPGQSFPGSAPVTPFTGSVSSSHWTLGPKGSSGVLLATAGGTATGNPTHMILPSSGITGPGSSLKDGHFDAYFIGPTNFFLKVAGVTTGTNLATAITGLNVGFGTGPDAIVGTTTPAVPEPSTLAIAGLGALGFIGYGLRRRLKT